MKTSLSLWALALALALAAAAPAGSEEKGGVIPQAGEAATAAPQEPIRITADRMEVQADNNLIIFEKNVVASQGNVTVTADKMVINTARSGDSSSVKEMTATGNVQFRQFFPEQKVERFATGQKAQYWDDEGKLVLTGEPKAWENNNIVTGEAMTFFTRKNLFLVDGAPNNKVNIIFYPEKGKSGPGAGKPPSAKAPAAPEPAPAKE